MENYNSLVEFLVASTKLGFGIEETLEAANEEFELGDDIALYADNLGFHIKVRIKDFNIALATSIVINTSKQ